MSKSRNIALSRGEEMERDDEEERDRGRGNVCITAIHVVVL